MNRILAAARVTLLGASLAVASAPAAAAQARQERPERPDCRCVDADGKTIEHCTCFRMPSAEGILAQVMPWRAPRARLGITISVEQRAKEDAQGARIQSVLEDGPADEAGLQEGDVLTRVDGHSLFDPLDEETEEDFDLDRSIPVQRLLAIVRDLEPGDEVEVEYLRDGDRHTATLEVRELDHWGMDRGIALAPGRWEGERLSRRMGELRDRLRERSDLRLMEPRGEVRVFGMDRCVGDGGARGLIWTSRCVEGLELVKVNPELGEYFGTDRGVLVAEVAEDSHLGLEPGDVILRVGDREVADAAHVRRILRSYDEDETISFVIVRDRRQMSVEGRLGG